jgi:hypothetical protein
VATQTSLPEAVLLTGGLATGKTSVAIEMGEALERAGAAFAVLDLDWLCWAWSSASSPRALHQLLCDNLRAIVPNLLAYDVQYLVMARAVLTPAGLQQLRDSIAPLPLRVVHLTAEDAEVVRRLRARDTGPRLEAHLSRREEFEEMAQSASPSVIEADTSHEQPTAVADRVLRALRWPSLRQ